MATAGPNYPGTTASLSNAGSSENAEAWVNPGNVVSDNGTEASITAATFDSPDISQLLVCSNFGFSIPAGATINGITVEIDRRDGAGAASDNRVQLAKGTTFASLVGSNKAATTTDWPTASAVASYGGSADLWGTTWTVSEINASSFAVMLSVRADAANTDIFVDFVRITITYTPGATTHDGALSVSGAGTISLTGDVVTGGGGSTYHSDDFGRTVASGSGWGGDWLHSSSAAALGVDGAKAYYTNTGSTSKLNYVNPSTLSQQDIDVSGEFTIADLPAATINYTYSIVARLIDTSNYYRADIVLQPDGSFNLLIRSVVAGSASGGIGSTVNKPGYTAGATWRFRLQVQGTSPTTIRLKVWAASGSEPGTWDREETDSSAALQAAGSAGTRLLPSAGTYLTTATLDVWRVTSIGGGGGGTTHDGSVSLAGAGTATLGGQIVKPGSITLAGAGTLAQGGTLALAGSLAPSGTGSITFGGGLVQSATLAVAGAGSLGLTPKATYAGALSLSGTGAFAQAPTATYAGALSLSGAGTLGQAGRATYAGSFAVTGTGTLGQAGGVVQSATLALTGTGAIAATPTATYAGGLAVTGTGTLSGTATGGGPVNGTLSLTGSGALSAAGALVVGSTLSFTGTGALGASTGVVRSATLDLAGAGSMGLAGSLRFSVTLGLAGAGSISFAGGLVRSATWSVTGVGTLAADGTVGNTASLSLSGSGSLGASGTVYRGATFAPSGTGSLGLAPLLRVAGTMADSGTGSLSMSGGIRTSATFGSAGAGYLTLSGDVLAPYQPLDPGAIASVTLGGPSGIVRVVETDVSLQGATTKVRVA